MDSSIACNLACPSDATYSSVSLESTAAKLGTRTCRPLQTKFTTLFIHIQWSQSRLNRQPRQHGQVVHKNTYSGIRLMQTRGLRPHQSGCTTHLSHRQVREFSSNSFVTEILLSINRSCSRYVKVLYSDNISRRSRRLRHMGHHP